MLIQFFKFFAFIPITANSDLLTSNQDVVDGHEHDLNDETDDSHGGKADTGSQSDLLQLCKQKSIHRVKSGERQCVNIHSVEIASF